MQSGSPAETWQPRRAIRAFRAGTQQPDTANKHQGKMSTRDHFIHTTEAALRSAPTHVPTITKTYVRPATRLSESTRMREHALRSRHLSRQLSHSPDLITDGAMNAPTAWIHNAAHTTFIFLFYRWKMRNDVERGMEEGNSRRGDRKPQLKNARGPV